MGARPPLLWPTPRCAGKLRAGLWACRFKTCSMKKLWKPALRPLPAAGGASIWMSGSDSREAGLPGMQNRPRWRTMNPNLNLARPARFSVAVICRALGRWAAAADPGDSEKAQDALTTAIADPH